MVTITLRSKEQTDQGTIYEYWYSGTPTPGYDRVQNRGAELLSNQPIVGGLGAFVTILPGEKVGIGVFTSQSFDYHGVWDGSGQNVLLRKGTLGTSGPMQIELYRADTKALIAIGTPTFDAVSLGGPGTGSFTNRNNNFPPITTYSPNPGGVLVVAHFLAGGIGNIEYGLTPNVTPAPIDGQLVKQLTGGTWNTYTSKQAGGGVQIGARNPGQTNQGHNISAANMSTNLQQGAGGSSGYVRTQFVKFRGITIPMGATINSAIMTLRYGFNPQFFNAEVKAVDDKSFTLPSPMISRGGWTDGTFTGSGSPTSVHSQLINRTAGVPWLKKTATPTLDSVKAFTLSTVADPGTAGGTDIKGIYEKTIDMAVMIQNLVNKFDYSNDSMFFNIGIQPGVNGTNVNIEANIYSLNDSIRNHINPVPTGFNNGVPPVLETTATSQGASIYVPKLVIDFTSVQIPVLRSCRTVDALLIAQGAVHGRCAGPVP